MTRNRAERRCCSNERSNVHGTRDMQIIAQTALFALAMLAIPTAMAAAKAAGWW